jgi:hypothetical protein
MLAEPGTGGNPDDADLAIPDNARMPELNPKPVLEALTSHPALRVFVHDGAVPALPARAGKRCVLLNEIALAFEPGVRYPERQVDDFLRGIHSDHAALRRYLVDAWFLDRSDGFYWRTGGSEEVGAKGAAG